MRPLVLLLCCLLLGCESMVRLPATPAVAPLGLASAVPATLSQTGAGQVVTIQDPSQLPPAVRSAARLDVAFAHTLVPVTRATGGSFSFPVPANTRIPQDLEGNLTVTFVMDQRDSQIMVLKTGAPFHYQQPPVLTEPGPAFLVRGLDVVLRANTDADPARYRFSWSYATSETGPWRSVPGEGKQVEWTPPEAGNFFARIDAVDRQTQQTYSAITPERVVFVAEAKDLVLTEPTSGAVPQGNAVKLRFSRPSALLGTGFDYAWSFAESPQGPWNPISGSGEALSWLPTQSGTYYIKVDVSGRERAKVHSFVTPEAAVFVNAGAPLFKPSRAAIDRGERIEVTLAFETPAGRPLTWYYAPTSGAVSTAIPGFGMAWTPIIGTGRTVELVATESGAYHFRVDVPQDDGSLKTFTSSDPLLSVDERGPLIVTEPANDTIHPGGSVTFRLNASGLEDGRYRYAWFVATNPQGGFQALPLDNQRDHLSKRFTWRTSFGGTDPDGTQHPPTPPGNYYVRVDAQELNGPRSYSFTSSTPVVTIQRSGISLFGF